MNLYCKSGLRKEPLVADTSTTAPPKQPTASDVELLSVAIGLELAMVDLYGKFASGSQGDTKAVAQLFKGNHRAAAQALAGLIGRKAPTGRDEKFFADNSAKAAASGKDAISAMAELENAMVATHISVLGNVKGTDGANLVASIIPIAARQAAVLVGLSGKTALDDILAFDPAAIIGADKAES